MPVGSTATDPTRVDPTGTTAQPVTDNGGSLTVDGFTGATAKVSGSFDLFRPADTNAYAVGDLIANSVTAGSVVAISYANAVDTSAGMGIVRQVRIFRQSSTGLIGLRLHFYNQSPGTPVNGDNGAFLASGTSEIGSCDVVMKNGNGSSAGVTMCEHTFKLASGTTLYAYLETLSAFTPANNELFTVNIVVEPH